VTPAPPSGSSASFELAVLLPLGVLANQLMKVESELRFLNAKISRFGQERGTARGEAAAKLEAMKEAIDAIRRLIANIQADIQLDNQPDNQTRTAEPARHSRTDRED
jgi:hypothetical protein